MQLRLLSFVFFCSGAAGLIYQVIWVRLFGDIFGNSIYSASIIAATFLVSLGIGAIWAGRWSDKHNSNPLHALRSYIYAEFLIATFGVALALLFPHLGSLAAGLSSYQVGKHQWLYLSASSIFLFQCLAVLLLFPITFCMGTTLSLLVRYVNRSGPELIGYRVGVLYAFNTLGAAIGAWTVDLLWIPNFGLFASQGIAAFLNLLACLFASRELRAQRKKNNQKTEQDLSPLPSAPAPTSDQFITASWVIGCCGFVGMSFEILWFRFFTSTFGAHREVFSIILGTILIAMWLGSLAAAHLSRRGLDARVGLLFVQIGVMICALAGFYFFHHSPLSTDELRDLAHSSSQLQLRFALFCHLLGSILPMVALPAFFMGAAYPFANCLARADLARASSYAGAIYFWNMLGATIGAIATGFLLIPHFGMQRTVFADFLVSLTAILLIFYPKKVEARSSYWKAGISSVLGMLMVGAMWLQLPSDFIIRKTLTNEYPDKVNLLSVSEGMNETVAIQEDEKTKDRILMTNGYYMAGNNLNDQRYMRGFAHFPLLQHENPESALVICFGVGNTANAISLYPSIRQIDIVDLSAHVLEHSEFFSATNHNVLQDSRVKVYVNDGRLHLRMSQAKYDLITLEPPPIRYAGVSALYTKEFYTLAMNALREGGFLTQWLPSFLVSAEGNLAVAKAFLDVFPNALLLNGQREQLILLGRKGPAPQVDPDKLEKRIASLPAVRTDLQRISLSSPTEFIGSFMASSKTIERATENSLPLTDDYPSIEFDGSLLNESLKPAELFDVSGIGEWCPSCVSSAKVSAAVPDLGNYLKLMQSVYSSDVFLYSGKLIPKKELGRKYQMPLAPEELNTLKTRYPYVRQLFL